MQFPVVGQPAGEADRLTDKGAGDLARLITAAEVGFKAYADILDGIRVGAAKAQVPVLGITGTGGAGKSSLVDELVRRFLLISTTSAWPSCCGPPSAKPEAPFSDIALDECHRLGWVYMRSLPPANPTRLEPPRG